MSDIATQPVETGVLGEAPAASVPAAARSEGAWPARRSRGWRHALLRRLLACADVTAALFASLSLAIVGHGELGQLAWSLVFLPAWIVVAKLLGLYDRDGRVLRHLTVDEAPQLVLWALIGTSFLAFFLELTPAGRPMASSAVAIGVVAVFSVFVLRALARSLWRRVTPPERVLVIGPAASSDAVRRKLELFPDMHMTIVEERDALDVDEWRSVWAVDRVILAPASLDERQILEIREVARATGVMLSVVPPCRDAFASAVLLDHVAELPFLNYATSHLSRSTLLLKRTLDVTISGVSLGVLLPLFAVIAVAIKLDSRGPVLFSQVRAGCHGRPFRMVKFRSMVDDAEELLQDLVPFDRLEEPMFKLHDDPRVTRIGRVLRRWSLDELPQLWNVLVGEMSLVGPRPEQAELVDRYSAGERFRLVVRPGITGPMQVYGRGQLSFAERFAVERDYIESLSVGRDLRILGMTLSSVARGEGAF